MKGIWKKDQGGWLIRCDWPYECERGERRLSLKM
jgi:hypothetical protein